MNLEDLKKDYIKTQAPSSNWINFESKLTAQSPNLRPAIKGSLTAFVLSTLIFSTVVGSAQAAKPGQTLYPLKILSDNVVAKITGKYEVKIEKRAQDVIDVSQKSESDLDEATKAYSETLEQTKKEAQKTQTQEKFKKTLEVQEQKLKEAQQKNSNVQDKLQDVIERTQEVRGEVKGQSESNPNGNQNSNENSQQGNPGNHQNKGKNPNN